MPHQCFCGSAWLDWELDWASGICTNGEPQNAFQETVKPWHGESITNSSCNSNKTRRLCGELETDPVARHRFHHIVGGIINMLISTLLSLFT